MSRRYQEPVEVRLGEPELHGVRLEPGWCRSAVGGGGAVDADGEAVVPTAFLWRGRMHVVRGVLSRWTQRMPWWRTSSELEQDDKQGELEQQVWRVEASTGRAFGTGVYDLVQGDRWLLERVSD